MGRMRCPNCGGFHNIHTVKSDPQNWPCVKAGWIAPIRPNVVSRFLSAIESGSTVEVSVVRSELYEPERRLVTRAAAVKRKTVRDLTDEGKERRPIWKEAGYVRPRIKEERVIKNGGKPNA